MTSRVLTLLFIVDKNCSNCTDNLILQTVGEMLEEATIMNREILKLIQNQSFAEALDFFTDSFEYQNLTASEFIKKAFGYVKYLDLPEPFFVDATVNDETGNDMVLRYRIDFGGRICNFHVRNVQIPPHFRIFLDGVKLLRCRRINICKSC